MSRLLELQQQLADSAAQSDVECLCKSAEANDLGPWYIDRAADADDTHVVADAIEYLTLRGRIERHPEHADWVRVDQGPNFDEVGQTGSLSRVAESKIASIAAQEGMHQSGVLMTDGKKSCIVTNLGRVEWFQPNEHGGIQQAAVRTVNYELLTPGAIESPIII